MQRLALISAFAFGLALSAHATVFTVHIYNFDFSTDPTHVQVIDPIIQLGDTVHWVLDEGLHTTQSVAGLTESWNSGNLGTVGQSYDHTFTHLGSFNYFCGMHGIDNGNGTASGMSGTITVNPVPEPATLAILGVGAAALIRRRRR